jgi:anaphase-promoting complex subunit 3
METLSLCHSSLVNTQYSLWILATSYYRNGEVTRASYLLKKNIDISDAKCILLYVRCCRDKQQYRNGLTILDRVLGGQPTEENVIKVFKEDASLAFWLLGELNRLSKVTELAVQFYKWSLRSNPLMWSSFQALCLLGMLE